MRVSFWIRWCRDKHSFRKKYHMRWYIALIFLQILLAHHDVQYWISTLRQLLSRVLFHTSWNKLVKRSFFTEQQLYFQGGIINEDQLWSYMLFRQIRNVLVMPNITYIYNKDNPINITSNSVKSPKHLIESRIFIYNTILDNPPKYHNSQIDYFIWILTYLARTLDIFEAKKNRFLNYTRIYIY